jgi:hypothetical protein
MKLLAEDNKEIWAEQDNQTREERARHISIQEEVFAFRDAVGA